MTNFVVSSRFKNQHSGRCTRFCHPKMSNFPSGCSKTTKCVTESTNGCSKTTKWVTESTNGCSKTTKPKTPFQQNRDTWYSNVLLACRINSFLFFSIEAAMSQLLVKKTMLQQLATQLTSCFLLLWQL